MTAKDLPSADELRAEVHDWLAQNWVGLPKSTDPWVSSPEKVAWLQKVLDAGYAVPTYPTDWFGREYPNALAAVIEQEFRAVKAPGARQDKYSIPANTALKFGTDQLKTDLVRDFLTERIRTCLLYSEPGAGSDLAAVRTTAVRDGDEWVVNGQKVWTSLAQFATRCVLLTRTGPGHDGITAFFLDMDTPGITVRPLTTMHDREEFCEVYFDDVVVPADRMLGNPGDGWKLAMDLLPHERSSCFWHRIAYLFTRLDQIAAVSDPADDRELGDAYLALHTVRSRSYSTQKRLQAGLPLGPE
ncbi:MAG: acyl-CoA dehydrogenase family protein, partial [Actinomycetes bacterium]